MCVCACVCVCVCVSLCVCVCRGDYANALLHYERGVTKSPEAAEHDAVCTGGVARMAIHTGDIRR